MALSAGTRLGPYEIVAPLGVGGMGEVYRARDTRLDRSVAIKILPAHLRADPERRARFEREAKTIAGLSHPHICTLHDVGQHDDSTYLVMEHLTGEMLAERLKRGPLPLEQALTVATDIADALSVAHRQGVIHRDLKPGNVMLTKTGAKLLDFGLAKLTGHGDWPAAVHLELAPTQSTPLTGEGMILGTLQYMAPEQVEGRPADARTDLWALGAILYEMLTGKRAFEGASAASLIGAILEREPSPASMLQPLTPAGVDRLVRQCLAKPPDDRPDTAHDVANELRWMRETSGIGAMAGVRPRRRWLLRTALMVGSLVVAALFGAGLMWRLRPVPAQTVVTSTIKIEPGYWLTGLRFQPQADRPTRTAMVISRDGRFVVYNAIEEVMRANGRPRLYLRRFDQLQARPIPGTEGGVSPFLSPDDRFVGFWASGKLKKVSIDGGVPVDLCDVQSPFGATWSSDNRVAFSSGSSTGLSEISAEGGKPESLSTPDTTKEEYSHRLPSWLPGGKGILFTVMREYFDAQPRVAVLDRKTRHWRYLLDDAADARYVRTGHLVFLRKGILMAVGFDLARLEVTGQPVPVVENVMQALYNINVDGHTGAGQFSTSDSGWLTYVLGGVFREPENSLIWVDQKGHEEPAASFKAEFFSPRLSPEGERVAYTNRVRGWRVWTHDLTRGIMGPLTRESKAAYNTWSRDGTRVIFSWWRAGPYNLYWQSSDGSSPKEALTTSQYWQRPGPCSDGDVLAFVEHHPDTQQDIRLLDLRSRQVTSFLSSGYNEVYPEFSPDGRWLAYSSDETGRLEVYVRSLSGKGGSYRISSDGGTEALWARSGNELFYRWGDQVWGVGIRTDAGFSASKPRLLFEKSGLDQGGPIRDWDLSLDGQRFLMVKRDERTPEPATEMVLVQNWFEELKAKVPVGR